MSTVSGDKEPRWDHYGSTGDTPSWHSREPSKAHSQHAWASQPLVEVSG